MREFQLGMTRKKTISLFTVLALAATISISPVQHRVAEAGVLGGAIGGALLGGLALALLAIGLGASALALLAALT